MNNDALSIISICDDWYANRVIEDFHKRKNLNNVEYELSRMNFAKRCCADDANLCEIISVAPEKKSASQEFIDKNLSDEDFVDVMYRTFFDREADPAGKADWLDRMTNQGYTREDVLAGFVGSQECADLVARFGI